MSLEAIIWAFEQHIESSGDKLVLLAIANYCDSDGTCYPSQRRIGQMTDMSWRSVHARIANLKSLGLIQVESRQRRSGGASSNMYTLPVVVGLTDEDGNLQHPPLRPTGRDPLPPTRRGILNPKDEPKDLEREYGEFRNVLLKDEEFSKLGKKLGPEKLDVLIEALSTYMAQAPKNAAKYKNHYATIIAWSRMPRHQSSAIAPRAQYESKATARQRKIEDTARRIREQLFGTDADGARTGHGASESGDIHQRALPSKPSRD